MEKKLAIGLGLGTTGIVLTGVGLVIRNKNKKEKEELTMEDMKTLVKEFIEKKKVSIYDVKTIKFIKKLKLNGEFLSEEQIKEILCNE